MTSYVKCPLCAGFVDYDKYAEHVAQGHSLDTTEQNPNQAQITPSGVPHGTPPTTKETPLQAIDRLWHTPNIKRPLIMWTLLMILLGLALSKA